jgi:hypothetical protein
MFVPEKSEDVIDTHRGTHRAFLPRWEASEVLKRSQ